MFISLALNQPILPDTLAYSFRLQVQQSSCIGNRDSGPDKSWKISSAKKCIFGPFAPHTDSAEVGREVIQAVKRHKNDAVPARITISNSLIPSVCLHFQMLRLLELKAGYT